MKKEEFDLERIRLLGFLKNGEFRIVHQINKELSVVTDYEIIASKKCKYTMLAYRALSKFGSEIAYLGNTRHTSDRDVDNFNEEYDKIEYLLKTDFTAGVVNLQLSQLSSPITSVIYNGSAIKLGFANLYFETSAQDFCVNWSLSRSQNYFNDIEKVFNIDVDILLGGN